MLRSTTVFQRNEQLLSERTTPAKQVEDDDYQCDNKQDVDESSRKMKAEA
jgi:hypothetical protein